MTDQASMRELLAEIDPEILLLDDQFDGAIVGYVSRCGMSCVACYDADKVVAVLARDMSYEDALEYYYFNIEGAYIGEMTPMFLNTLRAGE